MGGKTSTTTQSVQIPPEVLARYNAVNARAESVAATPFQQYGGQFVAGLTPVQQQGIQQASQAATLAQPYYGLGTAYTMSGAQDVGPLTQGQIGYYQSPYTQAVAAPTYQALRQQQGQELAQQQGQAIRSGAAFGDRAALERANLMRQQGLGTAQALAPIYQQGYGQAVQTAAGQQGVIAQDLQRRMAAGQQIAGLGTGAQQAALAGAQGALQAGTAEQQTQQADLTARYQQFLQERGYPFQVAQFLANIAMGTGALSGSTTTTTQPQPFFSDRRLKHDVKQIGKTNDGLPIYAFKYNGSEQTHIGLMAQDVEKKKPEAVGLAAGFKTVDYEKATEDSGRKHRDLGGAAMGDDGDADDAARLGGAVGMEGGDFWRGGYAIGGGLLPDNTNWESILARIGQPVGMYGQDQAMGKSSPYMAKGVIPLFDPSKSAPISSKMITAGSVPALRKSVVQETLGGLGDVQKTGEMLGGAYDVGRRGLLGKAEVTKDGKVVEKATSGLLGAGDKYDPNKGWFGRGEGAYRGGVIGRKGYSGEDGDSIVPGEKEDTDPTSQYVNRAAVPSSGFPDKVLESGAKHAGLVTAKGPSGPAKGGLGDTLKDAASIIGAGKTLYGAGQGIASFFAPSASEQLLEMGLAFVKNGGAINAHRRHGYATDANVPVEEGETADKPMRAEGLTGALSKFLPSQVEKRDGKYVEDLDVKRTLIPLLTGLGAMASSPSRYLGAAALQGLGAGAQSYANLEKQIADIKKTEMDTEATRAGITSGSFFVSNGIGYVRYVKPNGEYGVMEAIDYLDNPASVKLDPMSEKRLLEYRRTQQEAQRKQQQQQQTQVQPQPGQVTPPAPPPAPGTTTTPSATPPSQQPAARDEDEESRAPAPAVSLPPELAQKAQTTARAWYRNPEAAKSEPDVFSPAREAATAAQNQRPQLLSLGRAIASGPAADSPIVSGRAQEIVQPVAEIVNNVSSMFGLPAPINAQAVDNVQVIKKNVTQLAAEMTRAGNQTAAAALTEMANAIPTNLNSPGAQHKMMADIMAINQRMIDRGGFFSLWRQAAEGPNQRYKMISNRTGADTDAEFNRIYQKRIPDEKRALIRMFEEGPTRWEGRELLNEQGKPMSYFEFLQKYGTSLTQKQKNQIAKAVGAPNIMRYFGLGE